MALRWRRNGTLKCAKYNREKPGDTYINDRLHYFLSETLKVIKPVGEGHTWEWITDIKPEAKAEAKAEAKEAKCTACNKEPMYCIGLCKDCYKWGGMTGF